MKRAFENILSIFLFILGFTLLFGAGISMTGAAIGIQSESAGSTLFYGIIFLSVSLAIFLTKAETKKIVGTIEDLVDAGIPREQLDAIQLLIRNNYGKCSKEERKGIYEETADILKKVKHGERIGGEYNLHMRPPRGLPNAPYQILEGDAKALNKSLHQRGRGTERYIFDPESGNFLGVAYHPSGNPRDLRWRWRIRY